MKFKDIALRSRAGFTIVELLTVIAVIAILMSLLVPALTKVRDYAKETQQKAQFHSIAAGLELFRSESGLDTYPPSNDRRNPYIPEELHPIDVDESNYCGANKLAEAIVGYDLLGFHRNSDFRADNMNWRNAGIDTAPDALQPYDEGVYHSQSNDGGNTDNLFGESALENVEARKGPFIDLENANVYQMVDVYGTTTIDDDSGFDLEAGNEYNSLRSNVLCDVFTKKRPSPKKTGMPILYYRARTKYTQQDSTVSASYGIDDNIYYYPDNQALLELGTAEDVPGAHPLADGVLGAAPPPPPAPSSGMASEDDWLDFDSMILNPKIVTISRPYRADSYILISAGKDGRYGTPDDITNFEKN